MLLTEKKRLTATGIILVVLVILTRLPFATSMLYEFDSVDFAVGTFRYSLEQVTPHFPGYILHILFAKLILLFTTDINAAFVAISIVLSIGSVLYLWRAAAVLRGERVGIIAAGIWLFLPIFWFYGLVATVYEYEAFFACAFLYHGIKVYRKEQPHLHYILLGLLLSIATGARQSSFVFFAPALLFLALIANIKARTFFSSVLLFILASICWILPLVSMSGGWDAYWHAARAEHIYQSQSVFFGNSFKEHFKVIAKVLGYLAGAILPLLPALLYCLFTNFKPLLKFFNEQRKKQIVQYISLIGLPALVFYLAIFFMKAGYLLNVLPAIILSAAVVLDQEAIWTAKKSKERSRDRLLLSRPLITRYSIILTLCVIIPEIVWFSSGSALSRMDATNDLFTSDSFGTVSASSSSQGALGNYFEHIFSFSTLSSVRASDEIHRLVFRLFKSKEQYDGPLVLLSTWWHRWGYYYLPEATIYDIRDYPGTEEAPVGVSKDYFRKAIQYREIELPKSKNVVLMLRRDHPAFKEIANQVHLQRISMPQYLDLWQITDSSFSLRWKDKVFIKK